LTEAVRRRPYSVLLLDEIEKAHGDVFNILLQVLEDGRLTDSQGRTVDFRNTVIVMTSNLGADVIQQMTAAQAEKKDVYSAVMGAVTQHFRPEFLNRIDETVLFSPLGRQHIRGIASRQVSLLQARLQDRDLDIVISDTVLEILSNAGFDPIYGARPLKRAVQQLLENPLAHQLLAGDFVAGDTIYTRADEEGNILFSNTQ